MTAAMWLGSSYLLTVAWRRFNRYYIWENSDEKDSIDEKDLIKDGHALDAGPDSKLESIIYAEPIMPDATILGFCGTWVSTAFGSSILDIVFLNEMFRLSAVHASTSSARTENPSRFQPQTRSP